jgi:hypothetical protein
MRTLKSLLSDSTRAAEALAWLRERRAGIRRPPPPPPRNDPAILEQIEEWEREKRKCEELLAAIVASKVLTQGQRREHFFLGTYRPEEPEGAIGRHLKEVYLKLFDNGIYKLGETNRPIDRPGELETEYKSKVVDERFYYSAVGHELLVVLGLFEVIAREHEEWILKSEEARLNLEILRLETTIAFPEG